MELTLDKAVAYHRQLWDWLSENPEKEKVQWHGWIDFYTMYPDFFEYTTDCFACFISDDCEDCLLKWDGRNCCDKRIEGDGRGLFARWENATDKDTRSALARQIRDLPVRYPAETWNPTEAWRDA